MAQLSRLPKQGCRLAGQAGLSEQTAELRNRVEFCKNRLAPVPGGQPR